MIAFVYSLAIFRKARKVLHTILLGGVCVNCVLLKILVVLCVTRAFNNCGAKNYRLLVSTVGAQGEVLGLVATGINQALGAQ